MDYSDYDEAEQARRKKDVIEYRNKKRNSSIFTLVASICEILMSLLIFFVLFLIAAFVITRVFPDASNVLFYATIVILFLSLFTGFKLYKLISRKIIKKYHLEDKLLDSVLYHYKTKEEIKRDMDSGLKV